MNEEMINNLIDAIDDVEQQRLEEEIKQYPEVDGGWR